MANSHRAVLVASTVHYQFNTRSYSYDRCSITKKLGAHLRILKLNQTSRIIYLKKKKAAAIII